MDFDLPTSSAGSRSSLPPSGGAGPSTNGGNTPRRPNGQQNGAAREADALALNNVQNEGEAAIEDANRRRKGRRRQGGRIDGDVPLVRDQLGEQITESFQNFLETCVLLQVIDWQRL